MGPLPELQRGVRIALTFDDGPDSVQTPRLLDVLAHHAVHATFFVIGVRLESPSGKEIIRRAADEGHQVGNHTYSHQNLTKLNEAQLRHEVLRTEALIGRCCRGVKLLRPPFGAHNSLVDEVTRDLGYRMMLWNVDTMDWHKDYKAGRWVEHTLEQVQLRDESIVLAHDTHSTTVDEIDHFLEELKHCNNVRFATCA